MAGNTQFITIAEEFIRQDKAVYDKKTIVYIFGIKYC